MMALLKYLFGGLLICALLLACAKEDDNPFDSIDQGTSNPPVSNIPSTNFAYLHQKIFRPTCANSGCHDGTFEPEFRTIASAYNSLVWHEGISNDPSNTYTYRVLPGDANLSLLYARMTIFLPNSSGVMPLELDTGSDWLANEAQYIQAVEDWINGGALDMFGNAPTVGNLEPQVTGFLAFPDNNSTQPFPRSTGVGVLPIEVPAQTTDLWFSIEDDTTPNASISYNKMKISTDAFDFTSVPEINLNTGSSISAAGFMGNPIMFDRKADVDLSSYPVGTYLYVRAYFEDGDHSNPTEIPSDGTGSPMRDYFTLLVVP
jgi:hypothetical protein